MSQRQELYRELMRERTELTVECDRLRAQLSALTEERDTLRAQLAAIEEEDTAEINAAVDLRQRLAATAKERNALLEWRRVIIDANVVGWCYTKEHEDNPKKALNDLLAREAEYILDPTVSSAAARLRDTYKEERDRYGNILHELKYAISCPVSGIPEAEILLPMITAALSLSPLPEREELREAEGQVGERAVHVRMHTESDQEITICEGCQEFVNEGCCDDRDWFHSPKPAKGPCEVCGE